MRGEHALIDAEVKLFHIVIKIVKHFWLQNECVVHLLDGLLSSCQQSVAAIGSVLIDAIDRGLIACDPIVKSIVTSCASMPHWTVGIVTLGEILMKSVSASVKTTGSYICPFSLRYMYICILCAIVIVLCMYYYV